MFAGHFKLDLNCEKKLDDSKAGDAPRCWKAASYIGESKVDTYRQARADGWIIGEKTDGKSERCPEHSNRQPDCCRRSTAVAPTTDPRQLPMFTPEGESKS